MRKLILLILLLPFNSIAQIITTYAGNGGTSSVTLGDGGLATDAVVCSPFGVTFDNSGNLVVSSCWTVRKINYTTNIISTIAGCDTTAIRREGVPATCTYIDSKNTIFDRDGNYYVSDYANDIIQIVNNTTHIVNVYAGDGSSGSIGDGGPATAAEFSSVAFLAIDTARGYLYIPDQGNYELRRVDLTTGIITTIAGNGTIGSGGDGGPATNAQFNLIQGVCVDHNGNIFVGDGGNGTVRKINISNGIITRIIGNGSYGFGGDGGPATNAMLTSPYSLCFDRNGNLYVSDLNNYRIRKYDTSTHLITTIVGTGVSGFFGDNGPATAAKINHVTGICIDSANNLYIADWNNQRVRKVNLNVSTETNKAIFTNEKLSLYPNPTNSTLSINYNTTISNVSIYNLIGQLLYNNEYNNAKVELYVGDLAKGVYIIKVNGYIIQKFIKE